MKVIHKFGLASDGSTTNLQLKKGYTIVHSEYVLVDKMVCIWVEQTLAVDVKEIDVSFVVAKSGDPLPDDLAYVASAVDNLAPEAYHIFKKPGSAAYGVNLDFFPHPRYESKRKTA